MIYSIFGILAFMGIDKYLKDFFYILLQRYSLFIGISEIVLAFVCLYFGARLSYKLVKKIIQKDKTTKDYMGSVKFTNPKALLTLAIVSTLADLPTAFPYLIFIGMLSASNFNFWLNILFLLIYCLIYISPLLILQIVYKHLKGEKFERFESGFKHIINKISEYIIPLGLLCLVILFIFDGVIRI